MSNDPAQQIYDRLKAFINEHQPGSCRVLSVGPDGCVCPRCDIDRYVALRLAKLDAAARYVHDRFAADERAGYRSRDRQFAIEVLAQGLGR